MNSDNNHSNSFNLEYVCSILDTSNIDINFANKFLQVQTQFISLETKIRIIIEVISSNKDIDIRKKAIILLKFIISRWYGLNQENISNQLVAETKRSIFKLFIDKEYTLIQQELNSLCFDLMSIYNKAVIIEFTDFFKYACSSKFDKNKNSIEMIMKALEKASKSFGNNRKIRILFYIQFLVMCKINFPHQLKGKLSLVEIWNYVFKTNPEYTDEEYDNRFESLITEAMKIYTSESYGFFLINYFNTFKQNESYHIANYAKIMFRCLVNYPSIYTVENKYNYIACSHLIDFIKCFYEEVQTNCDNEFSSLIDYLINSVVEKYQKNPNEWLNNYIDFGVFKYEHKVFGRDFLQKLVDITGPDFIYRILCAKIGQLNERDGWKRTVTVIGHFQGIVHIKGYKGTMFENSPVFHILIKYLSSGEPAVMYFAIQTMKDVCFYLINEKLFSICDQALAEILWAASRQDNIYVKLIVLDVIFEIQKVCSHNLLKYSSSRLIVFLNSIFDTYFKNSDKYLITSITKSLNKCIESIYILMHDKGVPHYQNIVQKLLVILELITQYNSIELTHSIINCITKTILFCPKTVSSYVVSLILQYVDKFEPEKSLVKSQLNLQPCFLLLLQSFAAQRLECYNVIIPKIGNFIYTFLCIIRNSVIKSPIVIGAMPKIPPPDNYTCCFRDKNDGGLSIICSLIITLIDNYGKEFSEWVDAYSLVLFEIVVCIKDNETNIYIMEAEYKLMKCATEYSNETTAKTFWNTSLKKHLIDSLLLGTNKEINSVVCIFSDCLHTLGYRHTLNDYDIQSLCTFFNFRIAYDIGNIEEFLSINKAIDNGIPSIIQNHINLEDMSYGLILKLLREIIPHYQEETIDIISQMYKTLVNYSQAAHWNDFVEFFIQILNYMLEHIFPSFVNGSGNKNELLSIARKYIFVLMSTSNDIEVITKISSVEKKLKNAFPSSFEEEL